MGDDSLTRFLDSLSQEQKQQLVEHLFGEGISIQSIFAKIDPNLIRGKKIKDLLKSDVGRDVAQFLMKLVVLEGSRTIDNVFEQIEGKVWSLERFLEMPVIGRLL